MALECFRCARCKAMSRTWRGHLRFRLHRGQHRPTCLDEQACSDRVRDNPGDWRAMNEVWIDGQPDAPPPEQRRKKRNYSARHRAILSARMREINERRRRNTEAAR